MVSGKMVVADREMIGLQSSHRSNTAVAIGVFDGVHIGHQALIEEMVTSARLSGLRATVLTFDPHPLSVVAGSAPPLLMSLEERLNYIRASGVDQVCVAEFTADLARVEQREFAARHLVHDLAAREVFVGFNFRFGARGAGCSESLIVLGRELGFSVTVVGAVKIADQPVSSSTVRRAVKAGDMGTAAAMLGRPFGITGRVVRQRGRGRKLGYPTANVELCPEFVWPAPGVYAVKVRVDDQSLPGVANLGVKPTFTDGDVTLEIHLLDFSADLYDKIVRTEFHRRIRSEKKFRSAGELAEQIGRDCSEARRWLKSDDVYNELKLC